jgi:hypothetical protein
MQRNNQESRTSILECAMGAPPPYGTSLNDRTNVQDSILDTIHKASQEQIGILGASPPTSHNITTGNKRRSSRWDDHSSIIQRDFSQSQQGMTRYKPGSATWKRYGKTSNSGSGRKNFKQSGIPASPCRSDATSGAANIFDHDHWPLRNPTADNFQGTQDSRMGAFSPPQVTSDYCITMQPNTTAITDTGQANDTFSLETTLNALNQSTPMQGHPTSGNDKFNAEAKAPAFKAPQAP